MPPGLVPGEGTLCGKLRAGMGTRRRSVLTQSRGLSQRDWRCRRRRLYLSRRGVHLSPEQAQCTAPLQYGNAVPARAGPGAGTRGMQSPRARATGTREEDAARERATKAETRRIRRERKQREKNRRRRRRTATRRGEGGRKEGGHGERDQERKSWRQKTDKARLKRQAQARRERGWVRQAQDRKTFGS